ncbi:hypothetical protein ACEQ8H_008499 [Pleosporales sp. CAS-2024a]
MFIDTANANNRSARPQVTISSHNSPYNESSTPFLEPPIDRVPPPTYLEATTPGLYSSRLSEDQGARLLADGDREARDATYKETHYQKRSLRSQCKSWRWFRWIPAFAFIIILAVMLVAMAAAVQVRSTQQTTITTSSTPAQGSAADEKVNPPSSARPFTAEASSLLAEDYIGEENERPDLIAIPWPTPTPTGVQPPSPTQSRQVFPIRWPAFCGKQYNVKVDEYDFGTMNELGINEAVHQIDGSYKKVYGWIHVVRAPANQAPGTIQARLSYAASLSVDMSSIPFSKSATGILIGDSTYPDGFDGMHKGSACLGMSLVIYMAAGVEIDTLTISSTHLGMQIHPGVDFSVKKSTRISLTKGTLDSTAFTSRETYLETISGSISGLYSLSDLVSVTTKSGSVNIQVEPKAATANSSPSAMFMVDAHSSSIRTDFKRRHIPERDYQVYINTTVGSVDGTFIHGSRTEIHSITGFVHADLLPFKSGDYASTIHTRTDSGQTTVTLQTPYQAKNMPLTGLLSTHKTTSGELDLNYPQEWVGHINGTSLSGALHLQGKDVQLLGESDRPQHNHVEAQKGSGGGKLQFDTVIGECKIKIGNA